jgi:hypothetical protein
MVSKFFTLVLILLSQRCMAQEPFIFDQGGTPAADYYTVLHYQKLMRKVIVPVSIKGKNYRFLLDTGAPLTVSKSLASELRFEFMTQYPIRDQSGITDTMKLVKVDAITLGNIEFNNIPAIVAVDFTMDCLQLDGVIGSNILRNSIIRISSQDSTIIITDDVSRLNLNKLKKKQVTNLLTLAPGVSDPVIHIALGGKKTAGEDLLFDTGMDGLYDLCYRNFQLFSPHGIFKVLAQGYGSNTIGLHGVAADTTQFKLLIPKLKVNGMVLENVVASTTTGSNSRIGAELLDYGAVTIDFKNRKFYFEPFSGERKDLYKPQLPFDPVPKDGKLVVGVIWEKDLLKEVNIGDQIIAMNDFNCEQLTSCEMMDLVIPSRKDNKLQLTVKNRAGVIKTIEILTE